MSSISLALITQAGYFIAVFAAIVAGYIMATVTKKFGGGILSSGFKFMSMGIILIAGGIITDALVSYFQVSSKEASTSIILIKEALFVSGTYLVVIGSKRTADHLKSLAS